MRILIVEDEEALANGLKFNFEQEGWEVVHLTDGPTALERFQREPFDMVLLDLMLPGMSGYEICNEIRRIDNLVPIMVLSARTLSEDKIRAFDCGTDQYMTKPFALPELLSRMRNVMERRLAYRGVTGPPREGTEPPKQFSFGEVTVDFRKFEVRVGGKVHALTTTEMQLLRYFIEHEGAVLSRAEIMSDLWGDDTEVTTRTIDNFVVRLRRVIEPDPSQPRHIVSVRGTGYRFVANENAANP